MACRDHLGPCSAARAILRGLQAAFNILLLGKFPCPLLSMAFKLIVVLPSADLQKRLGEFALKGRVWRTHSMMLRPDHAREEAHQRLWTIYMHTIAVVSCDL